MHIETHAFPSASSSWMATHSTASVSPAFPTALRDPMKTDRRDAGCLRGSSGSGCNCFTPFPLGHLGLLGSHLTSFTLPLTPLSCFAHAGSDQKILTVSSCLANGFYFWWWSLPLGINSDLGSLQDEVTMIHRISYWAIAPPNTGDSSFLFLLNCHIFQAWDIVLCTCPKPSAAWHLASVYLVT